MKTVFTGFILIGLCVGYMSNVNRSIMLNSDLMDAKAQILQLQNQVESLHNNVKTIDTKVNATLDVMDVHSENFGEFIETSLHGDTGSVMIADTVHKLSVTMFIISALLLCLIIVVAVALNKRIEEDAAK